MKETAVFAGIRKQGIEDRRSVLYKAAVICRIDGKRTQGYNCLGSTFRTFIPVACKAAVRKLQAGERRNRPVGSCFYIGIAFIRWRQGRNRHGRDIRICCFTFVGKAAVRKLQAEQGFYNFIVGNRRTVTGFSAGSIHGNQRKDQGIDALGRKAFSRGACQCI